MLNKIARANVIVADRSQVADYERGRGTVVSFADSPELARVRARIAELGPAFAGLIAEGNLYDDGGARATGIGFHGDAERRRVVGVRLGPAGPSMPLHFRWFHRHDPVGDAVVVPLANGDAYIMSEKAVGTDWRRSTVPTLRHATGAPKYTTIKKRRKKKKSAGK